MNIIISLIGLGGIILANYLVSKGAGMGIHYHLIILGLKLFVSFIIVGLFLFYVDKEIWPWFILSGMINFVNCEEVILDDDKPSSVLRSKKESSLRKAIEFIKSKNDIGFVSAGNTGAVTALSTIILGTLEDIKRPAFCF